MMAGLIILIASALVILMAMLAALLAREMRRPPRHSAAYALAKGLPSDPEDLSPPLAFEEWWLDRPDGAQLPVWDMFTREQCEGDRSKFTAVLVHGWGHGRVDLLSRVDVLRPYVDRIVLYDLRGHGESRNCLSNLGMAEQDDLLAVVEQVGPSHALLVGHSMGAVIALKAVTKAVREKLAAAERLAGVIAYGPYCEFHCSLQGRLKVAGYPARPMTDLALLLLRLCGLKPLSLSEQDIAAIKCPILLIHGCDDKVAPLEHSRRLAQAAPRATLYEIENAAHVNAHAIDVERHNQIVRDFLQRISNERVDTRAPMAANAPLPSH